MDKKKVIELISDAIYQLDPFGMDIDNYDDLCKNATKILYSAKEELEKSDWVSVEDELPELDEDVLVCNKDAADEIYFSHRTQRSDVIVDNNQFARYLQVPITHWRKIDKLEE